MARYPSELPSIDIVLIGAVGFHQNLQKKENILFSTSLYEIDQILKEKQTLDDEETDEQRIEHLLPKEYTEFKDVFSEITSNVLLPYHPYNH